MGMQMDPISRNGRKLAETEDTPKVLVPTTSLMISRVVATGAMIFAFPFVLLFAVSLWVVILVSIWTEK